MTLESQYRRFLIEHPNSTFTFEEWKNWFGTKLMESLNNKIVCKKHGTLISINEPCQECAKDKINEQNI